MSESGERKQNNKSGVTTQSRPNSQSVSVSTSRKRKRNRGNDRNDNNILDIEEERYDRLFFTAHKQLLKHVKQVRTFLLQKEIRKLKLSQQQQQHHQQKQEKEHDETNNEDDSPATSSSTSVQSMKVLDVEVVTQQALRQLGLYHCNPRLKRTQPTEQDKSNDCVGEHDNNDNTASASASACASINSTGSPTTKNPSKSQTPRDSNCKTNPDLTVDELLAQIPPSLTAKDADFSTVNAVLTHKRFLQTMEEWNEKVTAYRRWCMQLEDRASGVSNPFGDKNASLAGTGKRKIKRPIPNDGLQTIATLTTKYGPSHNHQQQPKAMFVTLGGQGPGDDNINNGDEPHSRSSTYGPAAVLDEDGTQRKNRKGQRARRAKAIAIQAKTEGKGREFYYQSFNWRTPKTNEAASACESSTTASRNEFRLHSSQNHDRTKKDRVRRVDHTQLPIVSGVMKMVSASGFVSRSDKEVQQHPSWAAKQAQQTGIVAFKGTKITFE